MSEDHILLKWGTLKGYRVVDNPVAQGLIRQYMEMGASGSAMHQRDTPEQKQILCELLRVHHGPIINDWSRDHLTLDDAVRYIQEYGKG